MSDAVYFVTNFGGSKWKVRRRHWRMRTFLQGTRYEDILMTEWRLKNYRLEKLDLKTSVRTLTRDSEVL